MNFEKVSQNKVLTINSEDQPKKLINITISNFSIGKISNYGHIGM